ncbi:MAG: PQQ-binding-like beta-propeller repeat protein [Verrucomicrobiae bacterium]|nr:PQQ-binding-like beta-propeller repeat protein [Verrucomicrobiae bacterium]
MKTHLLQIGALLLLCSVCDLDAKSADSLRQECRFSGGIIVHLESRGSALSVDLAVGDNVLLHVLESEDSALTATRKVLFNSGAYGKSSAMRYDGRHLPYADNLINMIVCERATTVPETELLRVLRPLGTAHINGKVVVKPWPEDIDEWNHFLHGPDNNAVARDKRVNQPRSLQWVAEPKWSRSHEEMASLSAMVTARGRMFSILDSAPLASIRFNANWKLQGRDAFNGTLLWEREIPVWNDHLRHFRSGPVHLPRRLIAADDSVFVTLGLGAPVSHLDAASGKTIRTFEGTEYAEEILYDNGTLFMVVGSSEVYRMGDGLHARKEPAATDFRFIAAYDPQTGGQRWKLSFDSGEFLLPQTIGTKGDALCYQSTRGMGCVDIATGEVRWRKSRPSPARRMGYSSPTLVMTEDVVICSDREPKSPGEAAEGKVTWGVNGWNQDGFVRKVPNVVRAYSLKDGSELWRADATEGYNSPVDVFVIKDVAYIGTNFKGYDVKTGKVVKEVETEANPVSMPHPRCHRYKATEDFIITGRSGVEFIDLNAGEWVGNNSWLRGTCQYGVMPANGMVYVPPDACGCNPTVKVPGLFAARARHTKDGHIKFPAQPPLVKGPAFDMVRAIPAGKSDWPMYRHDSFRSGSSGIDLPDRVSRSWTTRLGGKLTQAVAVAASVYLASVDQYTVYALSQDKGEVLWKFTAGSRIDSAPTYHQGRLIFGSADGWVYNLDARTGGLVWKFRAAPEERMVNVYGRMESLWPVHGSVIVQNGRLCFTAGRSSYMDGGIILYQLDPMSGEQLTRSVLYDLDPDSDKELNVEKRGSFDMVGCSSDILSGDGTQIYLKHLAFGPDGKESKLTRPHLYSVTGMLDEEWFVRAYWRFGVNHGAGWSRWAQAGGQVPFGRIMCVDQDRIFAYGREAVAGGRTGHQTDSYHLFSCDAKSAPPTPQEEKDARRGKKKAVSPKAVPPEKLWSNKKAITVRAMASGKNRIVIAGPVDVGVKGDHLSFTNAPEARAAFDGKSDIFLQLIDKDDGRKTFELKITDYPSFDGLSIAPGKIFVSGQDGVLTCFGG